MNPYTDQEIVNKVTSYLFKQGRKSVDKNGNCLYRSPDGRMCAIGCLLLK